MIRKLFCSMVVMVCAVGFVFAEDFRASISKVEGNKVTFYKIEGKGKDAKKSEKAETLTVKDGALIAKSKFDKDTKKFVAGDKIEGGLKSETFTKVGEKGVGALITTEDGKISQILVIGGKKKKDAK